MDSVSENRVLFFAFTRGKKLPISDPLVVKLYHSHMNIPHDKSYWNSRHEASATVD